MQSSIQEVWYYYFTNYKSSTDTMCYLFISCTETCLRTVMVWHVYSLWWGGLSDFCVGLYRGARIYPPPPSPQMLQSSCGTRRKLCILNMHKLTLCSLLGPKRPVLTCFFLLYFREIFFFLLSQTHVYIHHVYRIFQQTLNTISSIVFRIICIIQIFMNCIFMHAWALSCSKA